MNDTKSVKAAKLQNSRQLIIRQAPETYSKGLDILELPTVVDPRSQPIIQPHETFNLGYEESTNVFHKKARRQYHHRDQNEKILNAHQMWKF